MKLTKRKILVMFCGIVGVILLWYSLKFAYYYRKVKRLVFLATHQLKKKINSKYFILTHINNVPIIILKDKPKHYIKEYATHFGSTLKIYPLILPHFFASSKKFEEFKKIANQSVRFIPKFYLKELRYMAKYSGINFENLVQLYIFSDYFNYPTSFLCSVFVAGKKKSKLNKIIIGRNLDYFVPFLKDLTVIHIFKKGKKAYISIGFLGVLGVYSGMNKDGLVISNLLALNPKEKPKQIGIPSSFLYRKILETQNNVLGAAKIIKNTYKPYSNNILLSDSNNSFVIEAYGEKIRIRKSKNGYVYATNYILNKHIRGKKHIGVRYRFLDKVAKTRKKLTIDDMKNILDGAAMRYLTQHSIIFIPEDRKIYFSYGKIPATKGPYIELNNLFNLINE